MGVLFTILLRDVRGKSAQCYDGPLSNCRPSSFLVTATESVVKSYSSLTSFLRISGSNTDKSSNLERQAERLRPSCKFAFIRPRAIKPRGFFRLREETILPPPFSSILGKLTNNGKTIGRNIEEIFK